MTEPTPESPLAAPAPAPQPEKPVVWPLLPALVLAVGLYLGANMVVMVAFVVAGRLAMSDLANPATMLRVPGLLTTTLIASELALAAVALGAPLLFRDAAGGLAERLQWRPARVRPLDALLLTVGLLGLGHAAQAAATMAGLWSGTLQQLDAAVKAFTLPAVLLLLVPGALGAGLCEELVFRGLLQSRLVQRFGPAVGVGGAALAFGLMHLDPLHSPLAFLMGLLLGWAAWRTGTIVTGVIAHATNNAVSFLSSWAGLEVPGSGDLRGVLAGTLVLAACVFALRRRWRAPPGVEAQPR